MCVCVCVCVYINTSIHPYIHRPTYMHIIIGVIVQCVRVRVVMGPCMP